MLPRSRSAFLTVLIIALAVVIPFMWGSDEAQSAEETAAAATGYPATGNVRAGVWNDGQAALWDLNFIDHFHYFGPEERARGYSPEQPVKFSHITHVQKNKMECQFCHWTVAKGSYAAIPEVETCMGCHGGIVGANPTSPLLNEEQKKEISKLVEYGKNKEPIPWVKVHVMPDYVKFNHKRHVKAGIGCHECHGQVPEMEQVERVSSMKMGWCISCHRDQGATIDCYACHR
ncbi:MAG: cytochrome c3 family protein [Deltaproteobacteria bacterium]|nr:cytochrome c3 family protein [Deltaproteobacteria bacterium]